MSRRMPMLLVATWMAIPGLAWAQDEEQELTPERIAAIRRDEQAAQAKVDAAYGNRKPSEMSSEERQQAIRDQQAAGLDVMAKHGVSDKDYARRVARLSPEEREAVAREEKRLEEEEKRAQAAREAEEKKKKEEEERALAPEDIPIQTGFGDNNPVELESTQDAASVVEEGLPPGAEEADGASEAPAVEVGSQEVPAAPAAPPAKKKKKRRK
jgi:hypothetical protein